MDLAIGFGLVVLGIGIAYWGYVIERKCNRDLMACALALRCIDQAKDICEICEKVDPSCTEDNIKAEKRE